MKRFIRGLLETIIMAEVMCILLILPLIATGTTIVWANTLTAFPVLMFPGWALSRIFVRLIHPHTHIMAFEGIPKTVDTQTTE